MTLAQIVIDATTMARSVAPHTWDAIPSDQWEIYWDDLHSICPSRLTPNKVKQRNALRIEILPDDGPRCSRRSPDGRGSLWFLSGGDSLSYGRCELQRCPRASPGAGGADEGSAT
jgi:hypothetical protein